jgi:hypothetical protein
LNNKTVTLKFKGASVSVTGPLPVTEDSYPYNATDR